MWQICSGNFVPCKYKGKMILVDEETVDEAVNAIQEHKYPILSLNECVTEHFDVIKQKINAALEEILPNKSQFER